MIPVTPTAGGTLQNPRVGGVCRVDPDGVITESDDGDSDSVTVSGIATTTTLASSANPSILGDPVTFTAAVSPAPTGGTVISGCEAVSLNSGEAACTTSALTPGSHVITAEYSGVAGYDGSTGTLSQEVNCQNAITVINADDSGPGSLRQAIADVCAGGAITFDDDYTITLASTLTIARDLTIDGVGHDITVSGNNAVRVFLVTAGVTSNLSNLTVAHGHAGNGGGIYNMGTLNAANVTFSGNSAGDGAGALENYGAASLTNVTFSGNSATNLAGAIHSYRGALTLTNVTFSGNSAGGEGGSIWEREGHLTLTNVIVNGNVYCDHTARGSVTGQNNIVTSLSGPCDFPHSQVDPLLGALGNYGGSTQSFALRPGSPAIDAGDDSVCPATDQRGIERPQGAHCDIGAFESQGFTLAVSGGDNQSALINTAFAEPLVLSVTANDAGVSPDGALVAFTPPASGASAVISGSPATVTNGTVSVTATANDTQGSYEVVASMAGAQSVNFTLTNTGAPPTITQQPQDVTALIGDVVSFTSTADGTPTPTVQWQVSMDSGATWYDLPFANQTTFSFFPSLDQDGDQYRAVFDNGIGEPVPSNAATLTVNKLTATVTLTASAGSLLPQQPVTFTAVVAPVPPSTGIPVGTVSFMEGATVLAADVPLVDGQAAFTTSDLSVGTHTITAVYSGDADWNGSVSEPVTVTVTAPATASISGFVFYDLNANGTRNWIDFGIQGWEVQLLDANGAVLQTETTNRYGYYRFDSLPAGDYRLRQVLQSGFVQTTTDPADITLTDGQTLTRVNFGVVRSADLNLMMNAQYNPTTRRIVYTITVTNDGPSSARGTILTDNLPHGVNFVSVSTTEGWCSGGRNATCHLGTLAPGESATIILTVRRTDLRHAILNTAAASSILFDIDESDNAATVSVE